MFTGFEEALGWIHGRLKFGVKPGIERMKWFMEKLDHPEKKIKAIHIAGTNGKGSTVAFIRSILNESGYQVGTFTSPYIITFNERISINGEPISDDEWLFLVNEIKPLTEELEKTGLGAPTEFEIITACAFLYFSTCKNLDFVIFETGLGGRLDSTNVVEPVLTLITTIGHDHMAILGSTLEEIAGEKAGIIKEGVPVITAVQQKNAYEVIRIKAEEMNAEYISLHDTCAIFNKKVLTSGEEFSLETKTRLYEKLQTSLIGAHQRQNATLAVLAAEKLNQIGLAAINENQIRSGLGKAVWPGRFEKVLSEPAVFLDGAHNEEGIEKLVETVIQHFSGCNISVVFSALKDKPYKTMIEKLTAIADSIHFTSFDFPRAAKAKELFDVCSLPEKTYNESPESIVELVKKANHKSIILVTGSLYFVSEARKRLKKHS